MARAPKKAPENHVPIGYEPKDLFDPTEVAIFDERNTKSVVNLVDENVKKSILAIPDEYWELSEARLRKKVKPDELTCRLRITFWDEYQAAHADGRKMLMSNVMRGVTYAEHFHKRVLGNTDMMAWICRPPTDFLLAMRDILFVGLERLRELVKQPIVRKVLVKNKKGEVERDEDGKPLYETKIDYVLAKEIKTIVEKMSDRVHGAVIQRMQVNQRSENLHVVASADPMAALPMDDLNAIDQQLTLVRQKLAEIPAPEGDVVDV